MFLVNSRLGLFSAAPSGSRSQFFTLTRRPFSRSYGAILPSSLAIVLSIALVFSTCPPVSVLVRAHSHSLEVFLGGMDRRLAGIRQLTSRLRLMWPPDFPRDRPTRLSVDNQRHGPLTFPRHPIAQTRMVALEY